MSSMLQFDSEWARRLVALYSTPDMVEQRQQLVAALDLRAGEQVIDIGCGPGLLAAELAAAVGGDGAVCGIDVSDDMLALARTRAGSLPEGTGRLEYRRAGAEQLPYADGSFDVAVSTQVLEYVPDVPGALAEVRRVLRPGGRVLILDTDWDSVVWHSSDNARMRRVLAAWEGHLVHARLPRTLRGALTAAGFAPTRTFILPMLAVGYGPESFGGGVMTNVETYVAGRGGPVAEEVDAWAADLRGLGDEFFLSLNRYVFLATRTD